jgi:hypothetical protein
VVTLLLLLLPLLLLRCCCQGWPGPISLQSCAALLELSQGDWVSRRGDDNRQYCDKAWLQPEQSSKQHFDANKRSAQHR